MDQTRIILSGLWVALMLTYLPIVLGFGINGLILWYAGV